MFLQTLAGCAAVVVAALLWADTPNPPPTIVYVFFAAIAIWLTGWIGAHRRHGPDAKVTFTPLGDSSPTWLGRRTDDDRALYWRWLWAWLVRVTARPPRLPPR